MLLPDDVLTALVGTFSGAVPDPDSYAVDPSHALYARNVQFLRGMSSMNQVGTRFGYASLVQIGSGDGPATTLINWYFYSSGAQHSIALYYSANVGLRGWEQAGNTLYSPFVAVTGAAGASVVTAGHRFYVAFYDPSGKVGTTSGHVYGWTVGEDQLFSPPLTTIGIPSLAGAGVVTAGQHGIAYLTTTRNGYTGRLQAVDSSGNFEPVFFGATGTNAVLFTLTLGSLPSYLVGGTLQVVMTTATNGNRWFTVPGAIISPLTVGANTVTVNINDDDLAATGTDVTSYLNLLQSSPIVGVPPFLPSAIFTYSSRMGYIAVDSAGFPVIYFSDPNNYQKITADQHAIYLDGTAKPVHGVTLPGGPAFIAATNGFYQTSDNGDVPVTWTPPVRVDGSVGILSPTCLLANAASGFILVASPSGLFVFQGGVFPELPISHHQNQTDWQRINWVIPTQVQVQEDIIEKRFCVMAPLTCQITNVTNASPAQVTTAQPHLFQTGLSVTIAGTGTSADGVRTITVVDAFNFTVGVASGGTATSGTAAPNAANCEMSWNYNEGFSPDTAKYCLRAFTAYRAGAIGSIFNTTNSLQEIWYAPGSSNPGGLIRHVIKSDPNPYRDVDMSGAASAIDDLYTTSNLPGSQDEAGTTLHDYHGIHFKCSGNGNLNVVAQDVDGDIQVVPLASPFALSVRPGREYLMQWFLRSEQQNISFGTNSTDAYFILSLIRAYYTPSIPMR